MMAPLAIFLTAVLALACLPSARAVSVDCLAKPSDNSCASYEIPATEASANLTLLCGSMPDMSGCSLRTACGASTTGPCDPVSLLADVCTDMPSMNGCQGWNALCAEGTAVLQCSTSGALSGLVPTYTARDLVLDACSEMTMPSCSTCSSKADCSDPLSSLGAICAEMPGMTQCDSLNTMCAADGAKSAFPVICSSTSGSASSPAVPQRMWLHASMKELILMQPWTVRRPGPYIGSCIAVIALGILVQYLKALRVRLEVGWAERWRATLPRCGDGKGGPCCGDARGPAAGGGSDLERAHAPAVLGAGAGYGASPPGVAVPAVAPPAAAKGGASSSSADPESDAEEGACCCCDGGAGEEEDEEVGPGPSGSPRLLGAAVDSLTRTTLETPAGGAAPHLPGAAPAGAASPPSTAGSLTHRLLGGASPSRGWPARGPGARAWVRLQARSDRDVWTRNLARSVLTGTTVFLDYMLMLIVMTFNVGLIVSAVLGFALGTLFFGHWGERPTLAAIDVANTPGTDAADDVEINFVEAAPCCAHKP